MALLAIRRTRHERLLNTNEPPDDSDSEFVCSVILEADVRLACLDDEISKLQDKLTQLQDERASLSKYLTRNKAILSPLRRMPPELLGEIFSWTLPSMKEIWARKHYLADSPWVLSHTSGSWRMVSLSIPSLWSRVAIDYSLEEEEYSLPLVEAQIRRAQNLKVHFYASRESDSHRQRQMFEVLSKHSLQWEELSIGITSDMVPLLAALCGQLSSLKRLWIQWDDGEAENLEGAVQSINCFQTAASLVEFGFCNQSNFGPVSLPTHQLTRIQLDGPWEDHRGVLKLAPNLIEARLRFENYDEPQAELIDLLHLRRLRLSNPKALDNLRAPALEELSFWVPPNQPPDVQAIQAFTDRSACPLRRLSLGGFPDAQTTIQMLQKFAFIIELVIIIDDPDAEQEIDLLISSLTISQDTVVAPHLHSLFFGCEEDSRIDYKMYLEMLKSRFGARSALRNAALLAERRRIDRETLRGLDALRGDGMDLLVVEGGAVSAEAKRWSYATLWI
ncbi:F-box domain-containing protein [Mycena sanguinolenta]|uniref:F-box domain-containing protein n=1 Tax=Mycena sanguinolenta TaxID=230812 RepID=A0A8H6Z7C7_9AGAR|nr:F-box domain-containing protein [Mycena sanguinolenta]